MAVNGVRRLEIRRVESPTFGGAAFGAIGAYEKLSGWVYGDLDPGHPLNAGIVNLDRAPRNAAGRVDYRVEFCLLRPVDLARASGWLIYEVPNRGNKLAMQRVNNAP